MSLLSIITINRNNRSGLLLTAKSVAEQDLSDCEWVIIDGASTDGSQEIFEQYKSYISYCVSEPDSGIYDAMNKGVRLAHGEYCLFLNSGDYLFASDVLLKAKQYLRNKDFDIYRCDGCFSSAGHLGDIWKAPDEQTVRTGTFWFSWYISHQSTFIRRSLLERIPYDESFRIAADHHFFTRIFMLEKIRDKRLDLMLSVCDLGGISNTQAGLAFGERKKSWCILFGEANYNDYQAFIYGKGLQGNLLQKMTCQLKKNSLFRILCIVEFFPLYCLKLCYMNIVWWFKRHIFDN